MIHNIELPEELISESAINFCNEDVEINLPEEKLIEWINNTIKEEQHKTGEINYIFCSDKYLLEVNKKYLNHDYYTDVITFDYTQNKMVSGDIYISVDTVNENAKEYSKSSLHELFRVMIHGVLHLLGYKDATDEEKKEMRSKEDFHLNKIDF